MNRSEEDRAARLKQLGSNVQKYFKRWNFSIFKILNDKALNSLDTHKASLCNFYINFLMKFIEIFRLVLKVLQLFEIMFSFINYR